MAILTCVPKPEEHLLALMKNTNRKLRNALKCASSCSLDSGPPLGCVRRGLSSLVIRNSNGIGLHNAPVARVISSTMATRRRDGVLHVRHDALLAVVPIVYCETVHVNLLLRLAPQLDRVRQRALLAKLAVDAAVVGAFLAAVPDGATFHHLEEGLEDWDAGGDDNKIAFDSDHEIVSARRLRRKRDACGTYDVQYNGSQRSS